MPRTNVYCDQCRKTIGETIEDRKLAYFSDAEKNLDFCSEECCSEWFGEEWKELGLDLETTISWKKQGFAPEQAQECLEFGLTSSDYFYYCWLKNSKRLTPKKVLGNEQQLREEYNNSMVNAQKWLEENYPNKRTYEIHIKQQLEGILDCSSYDELEKISISLQVDSSKFEIKKGSYWGGETQITPCIPAQKWLDKNYPKNGTCLRKEWNGKEYEDYGKTRTEITKLDISSQNLEGSLDLSDFPNLEELDCRINKLTSLNLSKCDKLKKLYFSDNHLTQIIYPSNPEQLTSLDIGNNNFSQDLSIFSQLRNLEWLNISNNYFTGSLEPLKDLDKLKYLYISNTDIDRGLEYLPRSVNWLYCSFTDRPQARVSDIYEELQPFGLDGIGGSDLNKWREVKLDKKLSLTISPLLPPQLINETEYKKKLNELANKFEGLKEYLDKSQEGCDAQELDYSEIHFNQWGKHKLLPAKELPIKLYNVKDGKKKESTTNIEELKQDVKETDKIGEVYANLSYLWGECNEGVNYDKEGKFSNLTRSGRKALTKAIKACEHLGIDHLWIDQLCINQDKGEVGQTERGKEVSKMRQYYSNGAVTLIAIDEELGNITNIDMMDILSKIVSSEWFTRSWTFQEGWLSKHTVFMFDDKLIDGRAMAGTWALNQVSYVDGGKYESRSQFQKGTKKIATPVGWTYYRDGYTEEDKVEMTLNQALKGIKNRGRSVPIDGVYSILGLLPYGEKVEVDYSKTPQDALYEVMKVAVGYREKIEPVSYVLKSDYSNYETVKATLPDGRKVIEYKEENGYAEPITWHGTSNTTPNLCWMPQIDEYGSTSVVGGMEVRGKYIDFREEGNIGLYWVIAHPIIETNSNLNKIEGGFEIESGLYQKVVKVNGKETEEIIEVPLLGTQATLNSAKKGKVLVVFSKEKYQSNKPFALLVEDTGKTDKDRYGKEMPIYHRLGLVELGNEKLQVKGDGKQIIIGNNSQELQAQIEIPPKK